MLKFLFRNFVELTGNPFTSALLRNFSKSRASRLLVTPFSKTFHINEEEMERPLNSYHSIHDLFTRTLKQGTRPIDSHTDSLISPVDGVVQAFGEISHRETFYIKGQLYSLNELLGSKEHALRYAGGQFAIIYLSPSHYHRIHYHVSGNVCRRWALGEKSYPVNALGEKYGDKPFSTNYRIITELDTSYGKTALVKVGALNINSISLTNSNASVQKGDEAGFFSFGSTVILLFNEKSRFIPKMQPQQDILMGERIGAFGN